VIQGFSATDACPVLHAEHVHRLVAWLCSEPWRYGLSMNLRIAGVLVVLLCGCGAFRRPVGKVKEQPYRSQSILEADSPSLVVEIDYLEGHAPSPVSVRLLGRRLALYTDKPEGIRIHVDDEIPAKRWDGKRSTMRALVEAHAEPPSGNVGYIYLMYLPGFRNYRGLSFQPRKLSKRFNHPLAFVYPGRLRGRLWVTRQRQESSVVVHEVGHLMGLVSHPEHYVDGHCTNSWCLMYDGLDARSVVLHSLPTLFWGYLPTRFCRACRRDLWPDGKLPGRKKADRAKVHIESSAP